MATGFTTILKLALPVQGELSGTWGTVVNDNITQMVEESIAGLATINSWSTNAHTLTTANGTTSESRCAMLSLTDTGSSLSGAASVVCPAATKTYIVKNSCGQAATLKTASGTGIAVPNGKTMLLFCDGTNVVEAVDHVVTMSAGTLTITGLTTFASLKGADSTTVTGILDEDNMASNSNVKLATQQSIKAYVDSQVATSDTLPEVLANGNTTGGTDVAVSTDDKVQFRDSAIYINSSTDGQLDIVADTEIQIAATTIDINGAINASGEIIAASLDISGDIDVDGTTNLDVVDIDGAVDMASTLTLAGNADFNGDLDVDGTTNLDVVDIDGAVDMASTLTVASNIVVGGTVDGRDVATDGTKLDGIEASADVTDTANVTAAGALMDSELTSIGSVKALNQGVATGDSPTFVALTLSGNADFNGDLDVDGTIEFDALSGTGSVAVTDIADEDNMSSNSATKLATQQSIKAYVDSQVGTVDTLAEVLANGNTTGGSNIVFGDSSGATDDRLQFGDSQDLSIFHNGSTSFISEQGTGDLYIGASNNIALMNAAFSENKLLATTDGALKLYFNGTEKLATASGGISVTGEVAATSLDISGDIDVDGTTNLDVVDIDGAVDMASTLAVSGVVTVSDGSTSAPSITNAGDTNTGMYFDGADSVAFTAGGTTRGAFNSGGLQVVGALSATGVLTANAGVVVDNITIDGTEIDLSSGDLTLDVAGNIILDTDGGEIEFKDGGTTFGNIAKSSNDMRINQGIQDGDIVFRGNDGGSIITALTLDMSASGRATFNNNVVVTDNNSLIAGSGDDLQIFYNGTNGEIDVSSGNLTLDVAGSITLDADSGVIDFDDAGTNIGRFENSSSDFKMESRVQDKDIVFVGNDGGVGVTALTLDMSAAGAATFNAGVTTGGALTTNGGTAIINSTADTPTLRFDESGSAKLFIGESSAVGGGDGNYDIYAASGFGLRFFAGASQKFAIATDGSLSTPTSGTSNVRFGVNAGNSIASGGIYNVLVGDEAGTAITTGDQNVAIGFESLKTEDTGSRNTAVGAYTLNVLNNDAQSYNTAMGYAAGLSVTTGVQNTLIGGLAGDAITTPSNNVALGYSALTALVGGENNVAIGNFALKSDVEGDHSTAIGTQALENQNFSSGTNAFNVAVGFQTGISVTTGVQNTLIGALAGDANTTASNNTAVGYSSLGANTTGASNTALGHNAAANSTTASNNTALGVNALNVNTTGATNTAVGAGTLLRNTTASNNTAVGYNALDHNTTGAENVAVGNNALDANTTASSGTAVGSNALGSNTTGALNTAVGSSALANNTSGDSNVAVGFATLQLNTTADNNTAYGYAAMNANTTGASNVAIGINALDANTTASYNTAVGGVALGANTTGAGNVAVGYASLDANTTASDNTAVGYFSLSANTTGASNTAVGQSALGGNTTGTRNTALGRTALQTNTEGNDNTSAGYFSMYRNTTGGLNTAFGSSALEENTTGANNLALGYNALEENTTASNNTAVGYLALTANTTAANNTALGSSALATNTTGTNLVAVGYLSLYSNTTGTSNVAMGNNVLQATTTGANNTAVGHTALTANTEGGSNVAIGQGALDASTTGGSNVSVGARSLTDNTTGGSNTAVGKDALFANTTASNNTALGQSAGGSITTGSNNIAIGLDSLKTGSPGGNITTGSNTVGIGDENITSLNAQVSLTVASDERDKTDFTDLDVGLDFVKQLKPYTYKWDKRSKYGDNTTDDYDLNAQTPDGTHKEDWLDIGFKAQDVEALEQAAGYDKANKTNLAITISEDGKQYGMQYEKLVPILTKAIQEQQALIESLTARIETLEG